MDHHIHIDNIEVLTHDQGYIQEVTGGDDDGKMKQFLEKIEFVLFNHIIRKYAERGNNESCQARYNAREVQKNKH